MEYDFQAMGVDGATLRMRLTLLLYVQTVHVCHAWSWHMNVPDTKKLRLRSAYKHAQLIRQRVVRRAAQQC
jgi:hypothetical protein